jgi:tetratricopeptide (TPR) repeat protein
MELAQRFRELRIQKGLTGTALARPKYTVSYVSQIEAGRRKPSPQALEFFAERLGVSPEYLATGIPDGVDIRLRYKLEQARQDIKTEHPQDAERKVREVLKEAEEYRLAPMQAQALSVLGEALARMPGRVRDAIDAYEQALEGELPMRSAGLTIAGLARAYRAAGDLSYATQLIESYLAKRSEVPMDPAVTTELHSVLVTIYFERGDVLRAERAAHRALAAADQQIPIEVRANAYWTASRVLAETKNWDEALELATRARILMESVDDRHRVAKLRTAYAFICLEVEPPRLKEAREQLDKADELLSDAPGASDMYYVDTERCRLALLEDKPEEALWYVERALSVPLPEYLEVARGLHLKGRSLAALGRTKEARQAFMEAEGIFKEHGARQQQAACWREVGELDLAEGNLEAAVNALRSGLESLDPKRSRT